MIAALGFLTLLACLGGVLAWACQPTHRAHESFAFRGAPWAAFFREFRGGELEGPRSGHLSSCTCGRTFIRTEADPKKLQRCQTCEHDSREGFITLLAKRSHAGPGAQVLSISATSRKRSR